MSSKRSGVWRVSRRRDDISHKALVARQVLARDHDRLPYPGMARQRRFDLAKFDTEAADLYLMIGPSNKLQYAVRTPTRQVPGAIIGPPAAPNGSATNRSAVSAGRPK